MLLLILWTPKRKVKQSHPQSGASSISFLDIILGTPALVDRDPAELLMANKLTLITGACGEIGHALLNALGEHEPERLVALDLRPPDPELGARCREFVQGDVLDRELLEDLGQRYQFDRIYHLASILSTRAERNPTTAHRVNVEGTLNLLDFGLAQIERNAGPLVFMFPSSIAVYCFDGRKAKQDAGAVDEDMPSTPSTIYGINKRYCEQLGNYFSNRNPGLDFRALRYPGLISADTVPTGGTSDYGPEMLHAAAAGQTYRCFVRPDTRLPFMAMPDAIKAALELIDAGTVPRRVYNVTSFSPTAAEIRQLILEFFPHADIAFEPNPERQAIVDSWPAELNDGAARRDWGWQPEYDLHAAFAEYLVPAVSSRYQQAAS